jgi:hypothetical protein
MSNLKISKYDNFVLLKEKSKTFFEEKIRESREKLALIFNQSNIEHTDWNHIQTINGKNNSKLFTENGDKTELLNGFKGLYKHEELLEERKINPQDISTLLEYLVLLSISLGNTPSNTKSPHSTASDFNGFKQKDLHDGCIASTQKEMIELFIKITVGIGKSESGLKIFLHNVTRIVLFKKVDSPSTWKDLRGIGIAPAWLMIAQN